jgi:hypothetical protein
MLELMKTKMVNERQFVLSEIIEQLNVECAGIHKPYKPSMIGFKTSHLSVPDLRWLHQGALRYRKEGKGAYGKFLFGSLKPKK